MPTLALTFDPRRLEQARWQYEATDIHMEDIAGFLGCSVSTVYRIAKRLKWRRRAVYLPHARPRPQPADEPARATAPPNIRAPEPGRSAQAATQADMIAGAVRSIERQLAAIQSIIDGYEPAGRDTTEVERAMRTLSNIARTLYALRRLEAAAPAAPAAADENDDDDLPTDLDQLRDALSARIEALVEREAQNALPDEPE